jgi:hypothetical protein
MKSYLRIIGGERRTRNKNNSHPITIRPTRSLIASLCRSRLTYRMLAKIGRRCKDDKKRLPGDLASRCWQPPTQSSAALGKAPRGRERIKEPCHRTRQRADREDKSEAHREQQCPSRRNAVIAEERDNGEFAQAPAAD